MNPWTNTGTVKGDLLGSISELFWKGVRTSLMLRLRLIENSLVVCQREQSSSVSTALSIRTEPSCAWIAARGTLWRKVQAVFFLLVGNSLSEASETMWTKDEEVGKRTFHRGCPSTNSWSNWASYVWIRAPSMGSCPVSIKEEEGKTKSFSSFIFPFCLNHANPVKKDSPTEHFSVSNVKA